MFSKGSGISAASLFLNLLPPEIRFPSFSQRISPRTPLVQPCAYTLQVLSPSRPPGQSLPEKCMNNVVPVQADILWSNKMKLFASPQAVQTPQLVSVSLEGFGNKKGAVPESRDNPFSITAGRRKGSNLLLFLLLKTERPLQTGTIKGSIFHFRTGQVGTGKISLIKINTP